jgi:hypothetical protein
LLPEPAIVTALDHAGPRPPDDAHQNVKRSWSERFANGCAIAVADELRRHRKLKDTKRILPRSLGSGTEPLTPLGAGTQKRIDVTVADPLLGLEIGVSLKGYNFKDEQANNYDKNLTGRLYELGDEVRVVHEHLPHAFMVGMLFLPLGSTIDKKSEKSASSFARSVIKLRERTGRLDAALHAHASRCDDGYVAAYVLGEEGDSYPRGVCRFLNVRMNPPMRGRPRVQDTLSLLEVVDNIVKAATEVVTVDWGEAEPN